MSIPISPTLAVVLSVVWSLALRAAAVRYAFASAPLLLGAECFKLLLCVYGLRTLDGMRSGAPVPRPIRFGFIVPAALYGVVNSLTFAIAREVTPAYHQLLIQQKSVWVVALSAIVLRKRYTRRQYLAVLLTVAGCVCAKYDAARATDAALLVSALGVMLIVLQSLLSSAASVWIEAMMKEPTRAVLFDDSTTQKLYYFMADSFQLYLFGIPFYVADAYRTWNEPFALPMWAAAALVVLSAALGLSLGAVFVFYSSVERSLVSATTVVAVVVCTGTFSPLVIAGVVAVVSGIYLWATNVPPPTPVRSDTIAALDAVASNAKTVASANAINAPSRKKTRRKTRTTNTAESVETKV